MALTNLLTLLTFATCALIISNPAPVGALSIESHHLARSNHHGAIARKRRSTASDSQRCKQRPTSTPAVSSTQSTTTSSSKASSTSSKSTGSASAVAKVASTTSSTSSSASTPTASSNSNSGGVQLGLAWATDNSWASGLNMPWYFHWADPVVPQLTDAGSEYVPEMWGTSNVGAWNSVVAGFASNWPKHIMGFNEPDIPSQANMSPQDAANAWMQYIHPYGEKGVTLVSPCIAFDTNWLKSFQSALSAQGGYFQKTCCHWYGGHDDSSISQLKSYVAEVHSLFGQNVWIPELGLTQASNPSPEDAVGFFQEMIGYFNSVGYVERVAVFGVFPQSQPIDDFAAANNAFFYAQNSFTPLGQWYLNK